MFEAKSSSLRFVQKPLFHAARRRSLAMLREYRRMERKSPEELQAYQLQRLQTLIQRINDTNAFYRDLWKAHQVDLRVRSVSDLARFPLVTKDMFREAERKGTLYSKDLAGSRSNLKDSTTGSSGAPFKVLVNRENYHARLGSMMLCQEWYGQMPGDLLAKLWRGTLRRGVSTQIREWLLGRYTISIYDPKDPVRSRLNSERIREVVHELNELRPAFIDGFASALAAIAKEILAEPGLLKYRPKAIVSGAEILDEADRAAMEKAFGCPVFNRYGGTEFGLIAHECEAQARGKHLLHTLDFRGITELVNEEVVFTDFDNYVMPLIRYRTGDSATPVGDERCTCGRGLGLIREIQGRVNDMFILKDGSRISSHLWHHYIKKCMGIENYQIIQHDWTRFTGKLVLAAETDPLELAKVKDLVESALPECEIDWEVVPEIPPGPGGKLRQNICLVKSAAK